MYRSAAIGICIASILLISGVAMAAIPGDVVINEIYPNAPTLYDGSEFIEIYNTTGSSIDIGGWVLASSEFDETCAGDKHYAFPAGTMIPAFGYIVVARDASNSYDEGFTDPAQFPDVTLDFEMVDPSNPIYEYDDPSVPNMVLDPGDSSGYDDQIRLIPGQGDYGVDYGDDWDRYEILNLYDDGAIKIDHVEYRYSYVPSDLCLGEGTSDNDAFPSYPDEGLSLGRLDTSVDTDNCANDLIWQAPTPRQQNVNGVPPDAFGLEYSPCVPTSSDPVTISCYVKEVEDGIKEVKCIYRHSIDPPGWAHTAWDTLDMVQDMVEDSLYTLDIAAMADQTQGLFYVWVSDTLDVSRVYPADARSNPYRYSVGLTDISAIQEVDIGDDSSYVAGHAKNITGVVTASRGTYFDNMFTVQQGSGDWSGIHVYDPSYSLPAAVGDSVILTGRVQEYYNLTEIYLFATDCYTEVSTGNAVYETLLPTGDMNTGALHPETYEGMLVRADNVTVTNGDLGNGQWEINDGSGPCIVDDVAYYAYQPQLGHTIESVWGIFDYAYSEYKIQPRSDDDIVGALSLSLVRYFPQVPTTSDIITVSGVVRHGNPLVSAYLYYSTDGGASFDSTLMATSDDSLYTADMGPFVPDLAIVDYYVEVIDSADFQARKPDVGTYDLRIGALTIYQVQSTFGAGDSSIYAGEPVNVSGVVTAAPGEYSDYNYFIQMPYSGGGNPEYTGVKVYDRTGSIDLYRGDSVTVSGDVWEYYFETEIAMFYTDAITIHSRANPVPESHPVTTASIDVSEEWEGVLVWAADAVVTDEDLGFGEWMISNGAAADTCRVGDAAPYIYNPQLDDSVSVRGVVSYTYGRYLLQPRDDCDICQPIGAGIDNDDDARPTKLMMSVAPNPIRGGGVVRFGMPVSGQVGLKVYNVEGELVTTLIDERMDAGKHQIDWNATNTRGNRVMSGIYFFKLETGKGSVINKVVVSR
ncbi:lamin tail domain-containing protein [Candidatus Eisenbacteria bacterium]|uniref:Lamin tail domain-containing protein n=1 Tax=Eiseniibacteriota bacterium TaxID=2212470 RepID=A0ABV6YNP3_UNCEI